MKPIEIKSSDLHKYVGKPVFVRIPADEEYEQTEFFGIVRRIKSGVNIYHGRESYITKELDKYNTTFYAYDLDIPD